MEKTTNIALVMVGAAWAHSRLREPKAVAANVLLFALAAFVVVGRLLGFARTKRR